MSMFRRHPARDHRTDYWNALNRGAPPDELARLAQALDPTIIAAIDRARALRRRRRQDPAFATRLEHTLMDVFATAPTGSIPLRPTHPGPTNGRFHLRPRIPSLLGPATSRRRWAVAQLATALLLLVTLLAIYLTFGGGNDQRIIAPPGSPVASTPVASSAADVPMYRANPARTGEMPGPGPESQPGVLWTFKTQGEINSAPALVDGGIYFGSNDGNVYALDAATGTERWRFGTGGEVKSSPAVIDGVVYVGSGDTNVYAIDAATGTERWHVGGALDNSSPLVVDGTVYVAAEDGLMALDAGSGAERWRYPAGGAIARSPAFADGVIYAGSADGYLNAIDAATGQERWRFQTAGGTLATPTVVDGLVYQAAFEGPANRLHVVDAATGTERWNVSVGPIIFTPAVVGGMAYAPSEDGAVYALDAASGTMRWRFPTGGQVTSAVAVVGDTIYAGGRDHNIYALDAATGAVQWRVEVDGEVNYGPVVSGGVAYVGTLSGTMYALGGQAAAEPVELVWSTEGGVGGLDNPGNLALDPQGRLWIIDTGNGRFQIFDADGTLLETWGTPGTADGQFEFRRANGDGYGGIGFAPDGSFYVLDPGNHRVQKFAPDRQFVTSWGGFGPDPGQFMDPVGLAVDAGGTVWVVDDVRNDVQHFDANGQVLGAFAAHPDSNPGINSINNLAVDAAGNLYLSDIPGSQVMQFRPDGTLAQTFGGPGVGGGQFLGQQPEAMAIDATGRLFVTGRQSVHVFEADGTYLASWAVAEYPRGIVLDGAGNVYVSDYEANTVQKFRLLPPFAPEATPTA